MSDVRRSLIVTAGDGRKVVPTKAHNLVTLVVDVHEFRVDCEVDGGARARNTCRGSVGVSTRLDDGANTTIGRAMAVARAASAMLSRKVPRRVVRFKQSAKRASP